MTAISISMWTHKEDLRFREDFHGQSPAEGDMDTEDSRSESSSSASSLPTPVCFSRIRELCSYADDGPSNENKILPPFEEIARIAERGLMDRENNCISEFPIGYNFNTILGSGPGSVSRQEWCSTQSGSVLGPAGIGVLVSSIPPFLPSAIGCSSQEHPPPTLPMPLQFPDSPGAITRQLSIVTMSDDQSRYSSSPLRSSSSDGQDQNRQTNLGVSEAPYHVRPQFDPCMARQDTGEGDQSQEFGYRYDWVESGWEKHCEEVVRENGNVQFRCIWPRTDTKSGRCNYQAKRQLVRRHIENTHQHIRRFICDWPGCNQRYGQKSAFAVHWRAHTGERPYKCKVAICNARFNDPAGLFRHMVQEHGHKPKTRRSNYPEGHSPMTTNRLRNFRLHLEP